MGSDTIVLASIVTKRIETCVSYLTYTESSNIGPSVQKLNDSYWQADALVDFRPHARSSWAGLENLALSVSVQGRRKTTKVYNKVVGWIDFRQTGWVGWNFRLERSQVCFELFRHMLGSNTLFEVCGDGLRSSFVVLVVHSKLHPADFHSMQSMPLDAWIFSLGVEVDGSTGFTYDFLRLGLLYKNLFFVTSHDTIQEKPFPGCPTSGCSHMKGKSSFHVSFGFSKYDTQCPSFWIIPSAYKRLDMVVWPTQNDSASSSWVWQKFSFSVSFNLTFSNFFDCRVSDSQKVCHWCQNHQFLNCPRRPSVTDVKIIIFETVRSAPLSLMPKSTLLKNWNHS